MPLLARLGDLVGHKKVLLLSTAVTALGSWVLAFAPSFTTFLIGWAIQGAYVVWLPLEIAIIHRRTAGTGRQALLTRRGAAVLVGALELAVIIGALTSGALVEATSMSVLLALPAIVVTLCFFVIWFGIEDAPGRGHRRHRLGGLALVTLALGLVMGGLVAIRARRPRQPLLAWALIVLGLVALVPFVRFEARAPRADRRRTPARHARPVAGAADRVPVRHVGARRADPAVDVRPHRPGRRGLRARRGRALRVDADRRLRRLPGGRRVHAAADLAAARPARRAGAVRLLVALGYALWLPFHDSTGQALVNMAIAGLGSGALVAALPAAAAAAAPPERTGFATGMTNATKTVGGAIASVDLRDRAGRRPARSTTRPRATPRCAATSPSGRSARSRPCSPPVALLLHARPARGVDVRSRPDWCLDAPGRSLTADRVFWSVPESEKWPEDRAPSAEPRPRSAGGKAAAAARIQQQQTWVDLQIRQAMERGDFDDLPGTGKPIEDLGGEHDPDWWLKKLVEREQIACCRRASRCARRTPSSTDRSTRSTPRRRYAARSRTSTSA